MSAADVCVATLQNIAMFRMTYPNKVFDYLAAGKPVVLAIDGVIRDVVDRPRRRASSFTPGDAGSARQERLARLADRPQSGIATWGDVVRTTFRQHFNRRDHGELFTSVLRRALDRTPRARSPYACALTESDDCRAAGCAA